MSDWTLWLRSLFPLVLCVLALPIVLRMRRGLRRRTELRLVFSGQLAVLIGFVSTSLSFVLAASSIRPPVLVAFILGAVGGALLARGETRKWELEIGQRGGLAAHNRREPWWSSPWVLLLPVAGALLLLRLPAANRIADALSALVGTGAGGVLLTGGAWVWWWARKQERQLGKPLVRPIRGG